MIAGFERDYRKAQEKGDLPSTKEIQRQLKELEKQTAGVA
jgi:hypothetical protein